MPSGRRITRVTNTFWYLRTVRNSFMECVSQTLIFVDLYGTAPRWVPSFCFFTVASLFITSRLWIKIIRPMSSLFILIRKTSFARYPHISVYSRTYQRSPK